MVLKVQKMKYMFPEVCNPLCGNKVKGGMDLSVTSRKDLAFNFQKRMDLL